jgi:protein LSM14
VPVQAHQRGRGRGRSSAAAVAAGGGRGRGHHPPPPEPLAIPTEEFDFQQQLEKFDKDKIVEEVKAQLEGKTVYQKDDFFDSLSCDALEQQNGTDRHQRMARQRRTDVATFGSVARQGGGRGRGTRGRGHSSSSGRGGGRQSQSQSQSQRERHTTK